MKRLLIFGMALSFAAGAFSAALGYHIYGWINAILFAVITSVYIATTPRCPECGSTNVAYRPAHAGNSFDALHCRRCRHQGGQAPGRWPISKL